MRLAFDYTSYCTYVVRMLLFLSPALFLRMAIGIDDFYGLSEDGGADNYDYHSRFGEHDDKYAAYKLAKGPSEIPRY
jgi:hypothetical protein